MIKHEYLELFNQSSIKKDIDMAYDTDSHITNSDVVSGSFNLNESAFATKELRFGSLVASQLSVKLYNTVPNLMDKQLNVSIVVDNVTSNPLKIGKYKVLEDKPTTDRLYKQIKAYDGLYEIINADVSDWYENLTFPMTLKKFRDSFFAEVGIEQVSVTLVNDNMNIEKTISTNSLSGRQVLSAICELNGAIGRMNRDGNFEYVILEVNPSSRITIDKIVSKSGSYEDFDSQPITKVQIRQTTDDIGAIVGENGNTYIVQDNFLVYGKSANDLTTIATNLLSVIEGISYTPFNIKAVYGNPCYEIGDAITVVTANKTFNSYMFNRTLKGIQAMTDTIKADGVEYYTENLNSANTQIQQLKRQTNELSRTVEETKSTITSIETIAESASEVAERASQTATSANATANNANTVANQANTKADDIAEDLENNYSTTVEMQSQIKQSADSITSTVSKTYSTKTETATAKSEAISAASTDATTKANNALASAKTDATTKANNALSAANTNTANQLKNYSTTTQMNSAIEQSASSIKSTVSATYTTKEEFGNLEIGGRNLLLNSKTLIGSNVTGTTTISDETYKGFSIKSADSSTATSGVTDFLKFRNLYPEQLGEIYTLSFYAKGSGSDTLYTYFYGDTGYVRVVSAVQSNGKTSTAGDGSCKWTLTDEWKRYWVTWTLASSGDISVEKYILFRLYYGGKASVCGCKLEKGDKATDWTPAPEDVDSSISSVDTKATNAQTTANTANSKATTNATNISNLDTRVANAESSIEQNADKIELRVKSTDYTGATIASKINQSASTVAINANHIKLEGLVTANDNFKVLTDGNIEAVNGKFSGEIAGSTFTADGTIVKKASSYSSSDVTRIQNIIVGNIKPTNADYEKYDLNNDGVINTADLVRVQRLIQGLDSQVAIDNDIVIDATSEDIIKSSGMQLRRNGIITKGLRTTSGVDLDLFYKQLTSITETSLSGNAFNTYFSTTDIDINRLIRVGLLLKFEFRGLLKADVPNNTSFTFTNTLSSATVYDATIEAYTSNRYMTTTPVRRFAYFNDSNTIRLGGGFTSGSWVHMNATAILKSL